MEQFFLWYIKQNDADRPCFGFKFGEFSLPAVGCGVEHNPSRRTEVTVQ